MLVYNKEYRVVIEGKPNEKLAIYFIGTGIGIMQYDVIRRR